MASEQNPRSRANLRPPWKPGESGNKHGTNAVVASLAQLRAFMMDVSANGKSKLMNVLERLYLQAVNGNVVAARFLIEQTCGRPRETLQIENAESEVSEDELFPLVLEYVEKLDGEELDRVRAALPSKGSEDPEGSS
jgi:metal-dependent amidase/aminoacylase/carboxypeptidase family protein